MKVKTTTRFTDLKEKRVRELGDVFEVTKPRYEQLKSLVEIVPEPKVSKAPKKEK